MKRFAEWEVDGIFLTIPRSSSAPWAENEPGTKDKVKTPRCRNSICPGLRLQTLWDGLVRRCFECAVSCGAGLRNAVRSISKASRFAPIVSSFQPSTAAMRNAASRLQDSDQHAPRAPEHGVAAHLQALRRTLCDRLHHLRDYVGGMRTNRRPQFGAHRAMRAISAARLPCHSSCPRGFFVTDPIRAISSTASSSKDQAPAPAPSQKCSAPRLEPDVPGALRAREAAVVSLPPSNRNHAGRAVIRMIVKNMLPRYRRWTVLRRIGSGRISGEGIFHALRRDLCLRKQSRHGAHEELIHPPTALSSWNRRCRQPPSSRPYLIVPRKYKKRRPSTASV